MDPYNNPLSSMDFTNIVPATSAAPTTYKPLPKGSYIVTVVKSQVSDWNGQSFIALQFCVADGTYRGRSINHSIWGIWDDNPAKRENAKGEWKALRIACGLDGNIGGNDTDPLGAFLKVDVDIYTKKNGYETNKVTAYYALPAQPQQAPAQQAVQPVQPVQPAQAAPAFQQAQPQYQQPVQPQGGIDEVPF